MQLRGHVRFDVADPYVFDFSSHRGWVCLISAASLVRKALQPYRIT